MPKPNSYKQASGPCRLVLFNMNHRESTIQTKWFDHRAFANDCNKQGEGQGDSEQRTSSELDTFLDCGLVSDRQQGVNDVKEVGW